jgi:hypothetical protein
MARQLRIEYPGAMYHVMSRGDQREAIFGWLRPLTCAFGETMRSLPILIFAVALGCSAMRDSYDPRLNGTWRQDHPTASDMSLTFSNRFSQICLEGATSPFRPYRVSESGTNYVVIEHLFGPHARVRLDFGEDGRSLLIPQTTGSILRFERVTEPDGAANRSQPVRPDTNRAPAAAGSGR